MRCLLRSIVVRPRPARYEDVLISFAKEPFVKEPLAKKPLAKKPFDKEP